MTDLAQVAAVFGIVAQRTDRNTKVPIDGEDFEKAFAALTSASPEVQPKLADKALDLSASPQSEIILSETAPIIGFPFPMASPVKEQVFMGRAIEADGDLPRTREMALLKTSENQTSSVQLQILPTRDVAGAVGQTILATSDISEKLSIPITFENEEIQTKLTLEGDATKLTAAAPDSAQTVPKTAVPFVELDAKAISDQGSSDIATHELAVGKLPERQEALLGDVRVSNAANDVQRSNVQRPVPEIIAPADQARFEQQVESNKLLNAGASIEPQRSSIETAGIGRAVEGTRVDKAPKAMPFTEPDSVSGLSAVLRDVSDKGASTKSGLKEGFVPANAAVVDAQPLEFDLSPSESRRAVAESGTISRVDASATRAQPAVNEGAQPVDIISKPVALPLAVPSNPSRPIEDLATILEPEITPVAAPEKVVQAINNVGQPVPISVPQAKFEGTDKHDPKVQIEALRSSTPQSEKSIYDVRIAKEDGVSVTAPATRVAEAPLNAAFGQVDAPLPGRTGDIAMDAEIVSLIQSNSTSASAKAMDAVGKAPAVMVPSDVMKLSEQLRAGARMDRFPVEIALDPPELGQVRMMLQSNESGTTLVILADRPETADLMRKHAAFLHEAFAQEARGELNLQFGAQAEQGGSGEKGSLGGRFGDSNTNDAGSVADTERMPAERSITDRHRQIGQMSKTLNLTL